MQRVNDTCILIDCIKSDPSVLQQREHQSWSTVEFPKRLQSGCARRDNQTQPFRAPLGIHTCPQGVTELLPPSQRYVPTCTSTLRTDPHPPLLPHSTEQSLSTRIFPATWTFLKSSFTLCNFQLRPEHPSPIIWFPCKLKSLIGIFCFSFFPKEIIKHTAFSVSGVWWKKKCNNHDKSMILIWAPNI